MAKDKYGVPIEAGMLVRLVDPLDEEHILPGPPLEVERVFHRDLDDEPLTFKGARLMSGGVEVSTWPSSRVVVTPDLLCAHDLPHVDGVTVHEGGPSPIPDGAIVIDGVPVVGNTEPSPLAVVLERFGLPNTMAELAEHLKEQRLDDLRAIANDLPISNMHDLDKQTLIEAIYACFTMSGDFSFSQDCGFPPAPSDAAGPGAVETGSVAAVEGEVAPPVIIEEGAL